MSSIIKRKGFWHIQYIENGRKLHRTTKISVADDPRKLLAKQVQRDFDSANARATAGVADAPTTIADGLRRYAASKRGSVSPSWLEQVKAWSEKWIAFFASKKITKFEAIRAEHIQEFINFRQTEVSLKTVKEEVMVIRSCAKWLNTTRKVSLINYQSWPTVSKTPAARKERLGAYTSEEVQALLQYFKQPRRQHWHLPLMFLAYVGCRFDEMASAQVGNVRESFVKIESKKTTTSAKNQFRQVELHPKLKKALMPVIKNRKPREPIFPDLGIHHDLDRVLL
ncbi:MAG TPA: hypothetical protein PKO06_16425, partial [Candidatus Ozemobacteraceae bacterium]|nr:hypothetical protein [Candidatus Ozemobacteraceae bacterium]